MRIRPVCKTNFALLVGLIFPLFIHASVHEHTLHPFRGNCWVDGQNDNFVSALVADSQGNLFGARQCGSGSPVAAGVFEISYVPGIGWRYSTIYEFTNDASGVALQNGLAIDSSGDLYGTTYLGGAHECGMVYKLQPAASGHWTETVLYNFGALPQLADGCNPEAGLIFDNKGNLYGTTGWGGTNAGGAGVAFELTPNSNGEWSDTVLHSFRGPPDGSGPNSSLVFDNSGNLYGTTSTGGHYSYGTVFELTPSPDGTWTETLIHEFSGDSDGAGPSSLVFDSSGNIYGSAGGPVKIYNGGEVFKLSPQSDGTWTESVLHIFPEPSSRAVAVPNQLSFDQRGILYGPLESGGDSNYGQCPEGCGGIFRLIPSPDSEWTYQQVYEFTGLNDGGVPTGPLIFDKHGNVYGTTSFGSNYEEGTVFQVLLQ